MVWWCSSPPQPQPWSFLVATVTVVARPVEILTVKSMLSQWGKRAERYPTLDDLPAGFVQAPSVPSATTEPTRCFRQVSGKSRSPAGGPGGFISSVCQNERLYGRGEVEDSKHKVAPQGTLRASSVKPILESIRNFEQFYVHGDEGTLLPLHYCILAVHTLLILQRLRRLHCEPESTCPSGTIWHSRLSTGTFYEPGRLLFHFGLVEFPFLVPSSTEHHDHYTSHPETTAYHALEMLGRTTGRVERHKAAATVTTTVHCP